MNDSEAEKYASGSASNGDNYPWSAAFISYITNGELKGSSHWTYINATIKGKTNWALLNIHSVQVKKGDLVCYWRDRANYKSHCDIIVSVSSNTAQSLGGNVRNTVFKKTWRLNNGIVIGTASGSKDFIGLLRRK
jgi:hypothetical protein